MNERVCNLPGAGSASIESWSTINELLACAPESAPVLNAFGVDTCCGGGDTIAVAAAGAGITAEELIDAVMAAVNHRGAARR